MAYAGLPLALPVDSGTGLMQPTARAALVALLLGGLVWMPLPAPALAAHEPAQIGLTPLNTEGAYFDLTMRPGESRQLEVELGNFGDEEVEARTYASDVYTIVNGGFGAELSDEEASGTTRWLNYVQRVATLDSGEALVISFEVTVPQRTAPGEYITSLVAENASPFGGPGEGGIDVDQVNRTAIAVNIEVPGASRPALEIRGVNHDVRGASSVVTFAVSNSGNVHVHPAGEFTLRGPRGEPLAEASVSLDTIYAGTDARVEVPLANPLAAGDYCAELKLGDARTGVEVAQCLPLVVLAAPEPEDGVAVVGKVVDGTMGVVAGNPGLVALAALGVVVGFVLMLFRRRRRRQYIDARTAPAAGPRLGPLDGRRDVR